MSGEPQARQTRWQYYSDYVNPFKFITSTRDDNISHGYTGHLGSPAVDPNLLSFERQADTAGRTSLAAVRASYGTRYHSRDGYANNSIF